MDKRICHECKTENEKEYLYCKNCGADLSKSEDTYSEANSSYTTSDFGGNYADQKSKVDDFIADNIGGIPMEQIGLYVGKKSDYYCRKFSKMELTQSKISWHWPAAVLGLALGPFGSAIWCFYRKMYKVAFVLVAIGVLLAGITSAVTYDSATAAIEGIINASKSTSVEQMLEAIENIASNGGVSATVAEYINDFAGTVTAIVMGMFANWFYRCSCVDRIRKYQQSGLDQRYYKLGLSAVGGTSGGMLAVGILIKITVENLLSGAVLLIYLLNR